MSGKIMKRKSQKSVASDMRAEYDFSGAVRGKYYRRYLENTNVVVLEPDVHEKFRNAAEVNKALRKLIRAAEMKRGLTKRSTRTARKRAAG
jgi:hypothetical protein